MIANMGKDDAMAAGGDVDDLRLAFPPGAEPPFRTPVAALVATAVRKGRRRRIVTLSVKAALFAVPVIAAVVVFANVSPGTITSTVRPASSPSDDLDAVAERLDLAVASARVPRACPEGTVTDLDDRRATS